ncbi:hypothetical protein AG1IA_08373 [Rhizoctonia solani AG-1 IA]|uniref:Uncharacterized protein n=1 Tax=Thanatephorus cucumeris (strain AG1-IA) TaxID=983506 RepID=L8WML8_THACA|nr:hypothetical protein AG1IA_08373 [Rhizoctonia solani AG-1 IA]
MNDMINNVIERYERYQKGDYSATIEPVASTSNTNAVCRTCVIWSSKRPRRIVRLFNSCCSN